MKRLDAIVPPCFHTAVANENVSLESEIKQWEEKVYCFDLIVDLPGEYVINEDGFLVSLSGKCDASEELTQSRCVVRLDKRRTLGDSLDVIAGTVASCCASFQSVENLKVTEPFCTSISRGRLMSTHFRIWNCLEYCQLMKKEL